MKSACLLFLLPGLLGAGEPAAAPYKPPAQMPATGLGFRGDGTGRHPDSHPPVSWDDRTGKNLRWRADLPNWGRGAPVPVGNRVLVLSEPGWKAIFPELVCLDADTGAQVWKAEVDPLAAFPDLPAAEKAALRQDVADQIAALTAMYVPLGEYIAAGHQAKGKDAPELAKVIEDLAKAGYKVNKPENLVLAKDVGSALGYCSALPELSKAMAERDKRLTPKGILAVSSWDGCGRARIGRAFPTPVSDGERVFVMTEHGTVAAFAMADGKLLWAQWTGRWHGGQWKASGFLSSPRVWGDLVLVCTKGTNASVPGRLHAYNRRTGQEAWKIEVPACKSDYMGASLVVMTIGATPVVLTPNGQVVRLPDGKLLGAPLEPALIGAWAVDEANDLVYFNTSAGNTPAKLAAMQLTLTGEVVTATERFRCSHAGSYWVNYLLAEGRLFTSGAQHDLVTGEILRLGKPPRVLAPATIHHLAAAGGLIYGLKEEDERTGTGELVVRTGVSEVFTPEGRQVARNVLRPAPWTGEKARQWIAQGFFKDYYQYNVVGSFSTSCPFAIAGDRLYIRSDDFLFCIDHVVRGRPGDNPAKIAAIRAATAVEALLPGLASASPQERHQAALAVGRLGIKAGAAQAPLTALIQSDPYEEIRAAAVNALDSLDARSLPGTALLRAALVAPTGKDDKVLGLTLAKLDAEKATAVVLPLLALDRPLADHTAGIAAVAGSGVAGARLVEALLQIVTQEKSDWYRNPLAALQAVVVLPGSPALTARLRRFLDESGPKLAKELQLLCYDAIRLRLSRADVPAFLLAVAQSGLTVNEDAITRMLKQDDLATVLVQTLTKGGGDTGKALDVLRRLAKSPDQDLAGKATAVLHRISPTTDAAPTP